MKEKNIIETHQIFKNAKEILGISYMASHWKKSSRQIYSWAADPDCCEVSYVNPLEKIKIMLINLKEKGANHTVISALQLLANPLGYEIIPLKSYKKIKKETSTSLFKKIILSVAELMKFIAHYYDITKKDKDKKNINAAINQIKLDLTELQIVFSEDTK